MRISTDGLTRGLHPGVPVKTASDSPLSLLVLGVDGRDVSEALSRTVRSVGLEAHFVPSAEEASRWLDTHDPRALAVEMSSPGASALCMRARADTRLASVPILGLVREVDDLAFPQMYGWGGDDVVPLADAEAMVTRLCTLVSTTALHAPAWRGIAAVAGADQRRRVVTARMLHNAGYDVRFALDVPEAVTAAATDGINLVIADAELGPDGGVTAVVRARAAGSTVPWVLVAAPKRLLELRASTLGLPMVAVVNALDPPENLLFVANELGRGDVVNTRSSVRLLHGTVVGFRTAGDERDAIGFTYNVSSGGFYVRTLAPPASGDEVWIELRPPGNKRRVRLDGKVAWRRRFGLDDSATVPPGFGVQLRDGASDDLGRYRAGYTALSHEVLGTPA